MTISGVFDIIWIVLSVAMGLYACYYSAFLWFAFKPAKTYGQHTPKCHFGILIAARNEEMVIGNLVESLVKQNYPPELMDIIVIPNNCTDGTRSAAAAAGARILDCIVPVRSKGDVLQFAVSRIGKELPDYDAVCIFDADNVVDPDFLAEMNNAYCEGSLVAQGYRDSKNPYNTMVSGCYSIYYWMVNRLYSHARSNAGLSAIINGSGFMVTAKLLDRLGGWNTETMTEDIEFTALSILNETKVDWVPNAVTFDEQPLTWRQSWTQRRRWSGGAMEGLVLYGSALWTMSVRKHSLKAFDQLLMLLAPLVQVVSTAALFLYPVSHIPLALLTSYLMPAVLAGLALLIEGRESRGLTKAMLGYGVFILSWSLVNISCLIKRNVAWKEIKHTCELKISEVSS